MPTRLRLQSKRTLHLFVLLSISLMLLYTLLSFLKTPKLHPVVIQGTWKQVRLELGLPPLQDTVLHPYNYRSQSNQDTALQHSTGPGRLLRFQNSELLLNQFSYSKSKPQVQDKKAVPLYFAEDAQEGQRVSYPELMRSLQNIMLQEKAASEAKLKKGKESGSGRENRAKNQANQGGVRKKAPPILD